MKEDEAEISHLLYDGERKHDIALNILPCVQWQRVREWIWFTCAGGVIVPVCSFTSLRRSTKGIPC